ncbi:MAG TPA: GNAT family N-acetyltransferase [Solirubrobacterales bacterium]|nr:GNAT family N-acetyltransferase [Solirubrobacterales bacterium]
MRIRPATEDDAAAVTALWTEAYTGRGSGEGRRAPYEEWEFVDSMERARVFVAVPPGGVVGVVALAPPGASRRVVAGEGEAELSRLAVAAAARRRGAGRALAELCTEQARAAGATALVLWSRPYQVEAHRLYLSLGYRRVPERDAADHEGHRLVFAHDLGSATGGLA